MPSRKASKRLKKEIMPNNQIQNVPKRVVTTEVMETFVGPLPDPTMLEKYKNAGDTFPERIMQMAEAHNKADINTKNRISLSNLIVPIVGQIFTLLLGAGRNTCMYLSCRVGVHWRSHCRNNR